MNTYHKAPRAGAFCLQQGAAEFHATASGSARQRRLKVRRWKALGWTATRLAAEGQA